MIYVSLPYATFGLITRDGRVAEAPPIAKWATGRNVKDVVSYYRNKGAKISDDSQEATSLSAEVSITVKAGPGYDEPWVTFKGNVDEVGRALAEFRQKGLFGSVKAASAEFAAAPVRDAAQAVRNLKEAFPNAEVSQELPESMKPRCPDCGAVGAEKKGHSTKQGKDYEGVFCSKECGAKPIEFRWL